MPFIQLQIFRRYHYKHANTDTCHSVTHSVTVTDSVSVTLSTHCQCHYLPILSITNNNSNTITLVYHSWSNSAPKKSEDTSSFVIHHPRDCSVCAYRVSLTDRQTVTRSVDDSSCGPLSQCDCECVTRWRSITNYQLLLIVLLIVILNTKLVTPVLTQDLASNWL